VHFVPCSLSKGILYINVGTVIYAFFLKFAYVVPYTLLSITVASGFLLCVLMPVHAARYLARDLRRLPKQFESFCIREAQCFCCTNNHIMPGTGEPIPCDRELVYETLKEWFSNECAGDVTGQGHLDYFDQLVRTDFARSATKLVGGGKISYRNTFLVGIVSIWFCLDLDFLALDWDQAIRQCALYFSVAFSILLCIISFFLQLAALSERIVGIPRSRCLNYMLTLCLGLLEALFYFVLYIPHARTREMVSWWPQVFVVLAEVCLTSFWFRSSLP